MLPDAYTNGPLGPVLIWAGCCDVISGILGSPQIYSAHLLPDTWHFLIRNKSFRATIRERERIQITTEYFPEKQFVIDLPVFLILPN